MVIQQQHELGYCLELQINTAPLLHKSLAGKERGGRGEGEGRERGGRGEGEGRERGGRGEGEGRERGGRGEGEGRERGGRGEGEERERGRREEGKGEVILCSAAGEAMVLP